MVMEKKWPTVIDRQGVFAIFSMRAVVVSLPIAPAAL
jgi:hypothetical protein